MSNVCGFNLCIHHPSLPSHYCRYCHCPPTKCYDLLFGKFMQVQIVCEALDTDNKPAPREIKVLVHYKYLSTLKQKILKETGILNRHVYPVPSCIKQKILGKLYDCSKVSSYQNHIIRLITNGCGNPIKRKKNYGVGVSSHLR